MKSFLSFSERSAFLHPVPVPISRDQKSRTSTRDTCTLPVMHSRFASSCLEAVVVAQTTNAIANSSNQMKVKRTTPQINPSTNQSDSNPPLLLTPTSIAVRAATSNEFGFVTISVPSSHRVSKTVFRKNKSCKIIPVPHSTRGIVLLRRSRGVVHIQRARQSSWSSACRRSI